MPRTHASPIALPDLRGRTALVTGASNGVGVEIARGLAGAGAALILPVRDRAKGERTAERIRATAPDADLTLRDLDLARLASVAALVDALLAERTPIDLLVLNAGIVLLGDPERHVSEDGFELHFQTNFLAHFALTTALLPVLRERRTRIVAQLSLAAGASDIRWNDLQSVHRYAPLRAYGASKVALGLFACELARRSDAGDWGVTVGLSHPGVVPDTGMAPALRERQTGGSSHALAQRLGNSPARAAQTALLAAVARARGARTAEERPPEFFGPSGFLHFGGAAAPQRPYRRIVDRADGARIWAVADALLAARADAAAG